MKNCILIVVIYLVIGTCYGHPRLPRNGDMRFETPACNPKIKFYQMSRDSYGNIYRDYSLDIPHDGGGSRWSGNRYSGSMTDIKYYGYVPGFQSRDSSSFGYYKREILLERWVTELNTTTSLYAGTVPVWIS